MKVFSVLYRKVNNKKRKNWDDDGVLLVNDFCTLFNAEGKEVLKVKNKYTSVDIDNLLLIKDKEIQIESLVDNQTYFSGKCFQSSYAVPVTTKVSAPMKVARITTFKKIKIDPVAPIDAALLPKLREHQVKGIQYMYECLFLRGFNGCILADSMGLGKTVQTLALLHIVIKKFEFNKCLILCPSTLVANWMNECKKWFLNKLNCTDSIDNLFKVKYLNIGICGYERARSFLTLKHSVDMLICDEGHRLKNSDIKTFQVIQKLKTKKRLLLTGTPIQNDLSEFYALIDFCNPGILNSLDSFKKVYMEPMTKAKQPNCSAEDKEVGIARSIELMNLTNQFILRRNASVNEKYLPPKTEILLILPLTLFQKNEYLREVKEIKQNTEKGAHLAGLIRLRKVCNDPRLLKKDNAGTEMGVKLKFLKLFADSLKPKEKCVIVSNYSTVLESILPILSAPAYVMTGATAQQDRQKMIDEFNDPTSRGAGVNLIGANKLLLFDVSWNPADDLQVFARIYRDGQIHPITIYRLACAGTIEETILLRQQHKLQLWDVVEEGKGGDGVGREEAIECALDSEGSWLHEKLGCNCDVDACNNDKENRADEGSVQVDQCLMNWKHVGDWNRPCVDQWLIDLKDDAVREGVDKRLISFVYAWEKEKDEVEQDVI